MVRPLLRHVPMLPAVVVVFVRISISKPSYDSDGFRSTARLLACRRCFCGSCRSRRKCVPCSPIVMAAPVLACDHPSGVVDGSTFTVMGRLAGLLRSRTPPRSSATIATAQLPLTCRVRVILSSASSDIASMSRGRTSSTPLFCSHSKRDRACARHPRIGAQVRALIC